MQAFADTICAISTPPGFGGIGVVRVSGPRAAEIAKAMLGRIPGKRHATFARFGDGAGGILDEGIALWFPGPASFTGEDVLELQGHGGPAVLGMVMERLFELGCRAARPGEFTERAFLNDRLDLAQAEAIADLITAGTADAARAAQRSLAGVFSRRVGDLQERLGELRVFVEAAIDFPEEEIDFLAESDVAERLAALQGELTALIAEARTGRLLHDGVNLAILGRPNAGKSSVLNALSGEDSAIVTDIPGTTRDVLREIIDIDGLPVHVSDTAGIRETADEIEREGVRRARMAQAKADITLLVIDASAPDEAPLDVLGDELVPARGESGHVGPPVVVVLNKSDLPARLAATDIVADAASRTISIETPLPLCALTGEGLAEVRAAIVRAAGLDADWGRATGGTFSARQRHVDALRRLCGHLEIAAEQLALGNGELLAEELRLGQQSLSEITGEVLPDDLLGQIFSSFCIGK